MNTVDRVRWMSVLGCGLLAGGGGCHGAGGPVTTVPVNTVPVNGSPASEVRTVRAGVLVTWQRGDSVSVERWRDDGHALVSELASGGQRGTVTVTRTPRTVRVDAAGRVITRDVPDGTVALENGSWQAYALAAEGRPADGHPQAVQVLVPAGGTVVGALLRVHAAAQGGRRVELSLPGMVVTVDVDARGEVTHARVPAQGIEVLPEGVAPAGRPAAVLPPGVAEEPVEVTRGDVVLRGTLSLPTAVHGRVPVVVLVAGSGPTDRDGNGMAGLETDVYRWLAHGLAQHGVATVRYDKRGVGQSGRNFNPATLTLDDFVDDATAVVTHVRGDARFGPLTLAGHSEGGLIAARVAQHTRVEGLLLVAAPGRTMGTLVREQLARQADAGLMADFDRIVVALRAGTAVDPVPAPLAPLFSPAVRTFLHSELDVDPAAIVHGLTVPTTVIQGETDAQVSLVDARLLAAARPDARLVILPQTNHVLKTEATATLPQGSYTDPTRPLAPGVLEAVLAGVVR